MERLQHLSRLGLLIPHVGRERLGVCLEPLDVLAEADLWNDLHGRLHQRRVRLLPLGQRVRRVAHGRELRHGKRRGWREAAGGKQPLLPLALALTLALALALTLPEHQ